MGCFRRKIKVFPRASAIFYRKTDNGFVLRGPKCINPENFIKIEVLSNQNWSKFSIFQNSTLKSFKKFKFGDNLEIWGRLWSRVDRFLIFLEFA
jgi:hypothetical protein